MSKVSIEVDTVAKTLEVKVDGKALDNVGSLDICKYCDCYDDDKEKIAITIYQREEPANEGDLVKFTTLRANDNGEVVSDKQAVSPLSNQISAFLKANR